MYAKLVAIFIPEQRAMCIGKGWGEEAGGSGRIGNGACKEYWSLNLL